MVFIFSKEFKLLILCNFDESSQDSINLLILLVN